MFQSSPSVEPSPRYRRRGRTAKRLLVLIFVMLRSSDAITFYFTYRTPHPVPAMRGNIIIIALWTTVFLGAVWLRKRWARYALLVSVCYLVFSYGLVFSVVLPMDWFVVPGPAVAMATQFVVYLGAALILARSRSIKNLCDRS
jgi:hypothetical protein